MVPASAAASRRQGRQRGWRRAVSTATAATAVAASLAGAAALLLLSPSASGDAAVPPAVDQPWRHGSSARRVLGAAVAAAVASARVPQPAHAEGLTREERVAGLGPAIVPKPGFVCAGQRLSKAEKIGAGAHGTVYADGLKEGALLAKVSYANTVPVVEEECEVMQQLEAAGVPNAARCLGRCELEGRAVAVMAPFFPGAQQISASLVEKLARQAQGELMQASAAFLARSLAAGIVISDIQALVRADGRVLFIDFTEAAPLAGPSGPSGAFQSLGEWCVVLPLGVHGLFAEAMAAELGRLPPGTLMPSAAEAIVSMNLYGADESALARLEAAAKAAAR